MVGESVLALEVTVAAHGFETDKKGMKHYLALFVVSDLRVGGSPYLRPEISFACYGRLNLGMKLQVRLVRDEGGNGRIMYDEIERALGIGSSQG